MSELKCRYAKEPCPYPPVAVAIQCEECLVKKAYKCGSYEQRPHGKWIYHAEWEVDGECPYECSKCGIGSDVDYDFCMRCGADMRKESEEE